MFQFKICLALQLLLLTLMKITNAHHLISYRNIEIPTNVSDGRRCPIHEHEDKFVPIYDTKSIDPNRLIPPIEHGGMFRPYTCVAIQEVAIIVPYRNRQEHLNVLSFNLQTILIRQNVGQYRLLVMEQADQNQFNRAKLFNVGVLEALKMSPTLDCFIFHDVELIPIDYNNVYLCSTKPRHMSHKIRNFNNFYEQIFGGVCAIRPQHFFDINGFSNRFFGWGGEDDEIRSRFIRNGYQIERLDTGQQFVKLPHGHDRLNEANKNRFRFILESWSKSSTDGINSVRYKLLNMTKYPLYTLISVDLTE